MSLVLIAYFLSVGGHFAVTQGVAWAGMIGVAVWRGERLDRAVAETAEGAAPCAMCLGLAKARAAEKNGAKSDDGAKEKLKAPQWVVVAAEAWGEPPVVEPGWCDVRVLTPRADRPLLQPPRSV
jgi:hypothetical protein